MRTPLVAALLLALLCFFTTADAQKKKTVTKHMTATTTNGHHKTAAKTAHKTKTVHKARAIAHKTSAHKRKGHAKPAEKNEETVMMDEEGQITTVEIKDGKIYVNGNEVSAMKNANREERTLIINHKAPATARTPEPSAQREENEQEEHTEHMGGKAMLGLYAGNGDNGAVVNDVMDNTPADDAGLRSGDIITKVDEHTISNAHDLTETIGGYKAGDKVTITYERDGRTATADVTLAGSKSEMGMMGRGDMEMAPFYKRMPWDYEPLWHKGLKNMDDCECK